MKVMKINFLTVSAVTMCLAAGAAFGQERAMAPSQGASFSVIKDLTSQEQAWAQACRQTANIYRQMATPSATDSDQVRKMKQQYAQLAGSQESAAAAAEKVAADHARLLNAPLPDTPASNSSSTPRNINTGLFTR
jgi:hypothetical protein